MDIKSKRCAATGELLYQINASAGPVGASMPWYSAAQMNTLIDESDQALRSRGFASPAMVRRIWAKHNSQPARRPGASS